MANYQNKKGYQGNTGGFRKVMESWPALTILAVLLIIFTWNVFSFFGKMIETGRNKKIAENKVAELENSKAVLSSDIATISTEKGVEETIREKFGLGKEGEGVVVIVEDKKAQNLEIEANSSSFFSFFAKLFK